MYDFSRFNKDTMLAINCPTEEEAREFMRAFRLHNPDSCKFWAEGETDWFRYKEETTYTVFDTGYNEDESLTFAELSWFEEEGYEVLTLEDLKYTDDFGELSESGISIHEFFSLEVNDGSAIESSPLDTPGSVG